MDDEPFALRQLSDDIKKIPFLELKVVFSSPAKACNKLLSEEIDLLFLAIEMPEITGIDFFKGIKNPPLVIFTTIDEKYAAEAFELNAVDYLIKPIAFPRFLRAAEKARMVYQMNQKNAQSTEENFFFVFVEYQKVKIFFNEITHIEGFKDYVKIFTTSRSRPIITRMNLKRIEAILQTEEFVRIHQSFVVALDKITSTLKTRIFVGEREIPVGSKYAADFFARYQQE